MISISYFAAFLFAMCRSQDTFIPIQTQFEIKDFKSSKCAAYTPSLQGFTFLDEWGSGADYHADILSLNSQSVAFGNPEDGYTDKELSYGNSVHFNAGNGDWQTPSYVDLIEYQGVFIALDSYGSIVLIDPQSEQLTASAEIFGYDEYTATGMCLDADSQIIWVMVPDAGIYMVQFSGTSFGAVHLVHEASSDAINANWDRSSRRSFRFTRCTVVNGDVYMVEGKNWAVNGQGALGVWRGFGSLIFMYPDVFGETAEAIKSYGARRSLLIAGMTGDLTYVDLSAGISQYAPSYVIGELKDFYDLDVNNIEVRDIAIDYDNMLVAVNIYDLNSWKNVIKFFISTGAFAGNAAVDGPKKPQEKPQQPQPPQINAPRPNDFYNPNKNYFKYNPADNTVDHTVLALAVLNVAIVIIGLCVCWRNGVFQQNNSNSVRYRKVVIDDDSEC